MTSISQGITPVRIFIASSKELSQEREKLIVILNAINKIYKHLKIEAVKWETDVESGSSNQKRFQDEIFEKLKDCQVVIVLFYSKVGNFTLAEYKLALERQKKIFVYFKEFPANNLKEHKDHERVLELKEYLMMKNVQYFQIIRPSNNWRTR